MPIHHRARFVCPPDHRHGEVTTCYVIHRCRCDECRTARTAHEARRRRLQAYGRYDTGLVAAAPVREHIAHLQAFGYGWKRIAALSGVGETAVESLIYGRKGSSADPRKGEVIKRTTREKADKILAVKPDVSLLAGGVSIPSRGTHRRLQALVVMGWSQSKLAERIGMNRANFGTMMHRDQVSVRTHRQVEALFNELWDQEPPHEEWRSLQSFNRAKRYAKEHGWLSPLAWDDIDNDPEAPMQDEEGNVDEMAVDLAVQGEKVRLNAAERRLAVARLHGLRWSDQRIAERLHIAGRTVLRIRQELGLAAFGMGEMTRRAAA